MLDTMLDHLVPLFIQHLLDDHKAWVEGGAVGAQEDHKGWVDGAPLEAEEDSLNNPLEWGEGAIPIEIWGEKGGEVAKSIMSKY